MKIKLNQEDRLMGKNGYILNELRRVDLLRLLFGSPSGCDRESFFKRLDSKLF